MDAKARDFTVTPALRVQRCAIGRALMDSD